MFRSKTLACSFCGRDASQVSKLAAGPKVYICDACVAEASRVMREASSGERQQPASEAHRTTLVELREPDDRCFVPHGWRNVTPRIVVRDAPRFVEFVKRVFEATGDYRSDRPTTLGIGDSMVMISEAGIRPPTPAFLYVYVEDADETYRRAIEGGGRSLEKPSDVPYGDRRAMIEDEWGNAWQIATHLGSSGIKPVSA